MRAVRARGSPHLVRPESGQPWPCCSTTVRLRNGLD